MRQKPPVISPGPAAGEDKTREDFLLAAFLARHEGAVIGLLCLLACLRVAIYIAAFPLFTNVDEQAHYDLVVKYARGCVPAGLETYDPASARTIAVFGSPEYFLPPGEETPPPLWPLGPKLAAALTARTALAWQSERNHESNQPPLYYALAGAWCRLGRGLGLESGLGAYWIRYLNVLIYGLLVWGAYAFTKQFGPPGPFLRFAVPLVLAFLPQDVFYSINNDVLSPLFFLAAFYGLMYLGLQDAKGYGVYLLTGLLTAATFLVKLSNFAILGALGAVVIWRGLRTVRGGQRGEEFPKLAVLLAAAGLPLACFFLRNYLVLGDFTGAAGKIAFLGWTPKPWGEIWQHPLFSLQGAAIFGQELLASFWRGEITWHLKRLASPVFDHFYSWSSLLFLPVAAVLVRPRGGDAGNTRFMVLLSLLVVGLSVAFLIVVSLAFDFQQCFYPSRQYPYVTSGRLLLGPLVPFLVLYLLGYDYCMSKLGLSRYRLVFLMVIMLLVTVSEIVLTYPVFRSKYNLFHMLLY